MRRLKKIMIYALLLGGSLLFLTPLAWMAATGLKPLDQTMSMPPTWLPYRTYWNDGAKRVEVKIGEQVTVPSVVVEYEGQRQIVPAANLEDGKLIQRNAAGEEARREVRVLQRVPATESEPWSLIILEDSTKGAWQLVADATIDRKIAPRWSNFINAVRAMQYFPRYLRNTLVLCFLTVLGTVFSSALAAYGFSRIEWRGRNKVFIVALATMMVPFPVVMVPLYCLYRWLGWIGTLRPLWVGSFFAGAFNVFLLRQFFMTIPKDLSDAARVDGCSEFRIFWQIMLPLCRPALMVVGLFQFMGTWNDFLGPLIYLTDQSDFTLALGLQFFQSQHGGTEWHYLMAASTLVALPIIVLFFFTQRSFIEGISMTGLKG